MPKSRIRILVFLLTITLVFVSTAAAQVKPVAHGLWVWKGPTVVATEQGTKSLRDFCVAQSINEVYISVSAQGAPEANAHLARAIAQTARAFRRQRSMGF